MLKTGTSAEGKEAGTEGKQRKGEGARPSHQVIWNPDVRGVLVWASFLLKQNKSVNTKES